MHYVPFGDKNDPQKHYSKLEIGEILTNGLVYEYLDDTMQYVLLSSFKSWISNGNIRVMCLGLNYKNMTVMFSVP